MKISVKENRSNIHFTIYLPNMLLTSAPVRWIIKKALEQNASECGVSEEQVMQILKVMISAVRNHGHYELVRVESRDGDIVIIQV